MFDVIESIVVLVVGILILISILIIVLITAVEACASLGMMIYSIIRRNKK